LNKRIKIEGGSGLDKRNEDSLHSYERIVLRVNQIAVFKKKDRRAASVLNQQSTCLPLMAENADQICQRVLTQVSGQDGKTCTCHWSSLPQSAAKLIKLFAICQSPSAINLDYYFLKS
jgi:hypothetical protein